MQEKDIQKVIPPDPPPPPPSVVQERRSMKWLWILGICGLLLGYVVADQGHEPIETTMFMWLAAGLLAGRAIDRWKEGGLRRWLYLLPLAGMIAINLSLMAIGWSSWKTVEKRKLPSEKNAQELNSDRSGK